MLSLIGTSESLWAQASPYNPPQFNASQYNRYMTTPAAKLHSLVPFLRLLQREMRNPGLLNQRPSRLPTRALNR